MHPILRRAKIVASPRALAAALAVLLVANGLTLTTSRSPRHPSALGPNEPATFASPGAHVSTGVPSPGTSPSVPPSLSDRVYSSAPPGAYIPGLGHKPIGVHGNKIVIAYYWTGHQTEEAASQLGPTGQRGALDEAEAFRAFVAYINKHGNAHDGATFMGFPFDLHGYQLDITYDKCPRNDCVFDAGDTPDQFRAQATTIAEQVQPFAVVSSHGSLSWYACPIFSAAHIFMPVTYDLNWGLYARTGGWCQPQGLDFAKQVQVSIPYLKRWAAQPYVDPTGATQPRRFGLLYADYPELGDAVSRIQKIFDAAGIKIDGTYGLDEDLSKAGPEAANGAVPYFAGKHINTIIAPDSGSPITFTHAAQSAGYTPDYYVWPCSGEDAAGQVRLYDPAQWARARGRSCYDPNFTLDLTLDSNARKSQWFKQYQEIMGTSNDPPSTSPLVYQGLLSLLVGITNGGPELTVENFFAGIHRFHAYRYNAAAGPTTDPQNFTVEMGGPDGSQIGDVADVHWSNTTTTPGNSAPGAYVFEGTRRYAPGEPS